MTIPDVREILDRSPPHSLEAEVAVLSSILLRPVMIDEVLPILSSSDFYCPAYRTIFEHMETLHDRGRPVDVTLLTESLKDAGDFEQVGGSGGMGRIVLAAATWAHAVYYAGVVRDKSRRRRIIDASAMAIRDAHGNADAAAVIASLVGELDGIELRPSGPLADAHAIATLVIDNYEARKVGQLDAITTGLPSLDRLIGGGFGFTDYIVLGARTSFGKTALALSMLAHIARDVNRLAFIVSIEMTRAEIADRMAASLGSLPSLQLRLGKLSPAEEQELISTAGEMSQFSFLVDDSPQHTVSSIARTARREARRKPLSCVVVDYLQLIEATKRADRRDMELAQMSRKFKALAQELRCPVICLAQLNKEADGGRPRMSHLREADSISHEANIVLLLDRPEFNTERPPGDGEPCRLIVDKNRNGPRGVSVPLLWFDKYTRFVEADNRHEAVDQFNDRGGL